MPNRSALYCRVSSDKQAEKETPIQFQLGHLRSWSKELSREVYREYVDEGFSGETTQRPAYKRLIADAEAGLIDYIMVHAVDRFGRCFAVASDWERLKQYHGVKFSWFMDGIVDDTGREYEIGTKIAAAKHDNQQRRVRVSMGQRQAVMLGRLGYGGFAPFGYRADYKRVGNRMEKSFHPDPATAPIVTELFKRYANGESIRSLQRWLNGEQIQTPAVARGAKPRGVSHGTWLEGTILRILRNPVYQGDIAIGRRKTMRSQSGKQTARYVHDASTWVVTEGTHKPLVDRATFAAVQRRRESNKQCRAAVGHPGNMLSEGIGRCIACGGTVTIESNGDRYYFYCRNYRRLKIGDPSRCGGTVRLDEVRAQLEAAVALYLAMKPDAVLKAVERYNKRALEAAISPELAAASGMLTKAQRSEQNLLAAIKVGGDVVQLVSALRDVSEEKERLLRTVSQLEAAEAGKFKPVDGATFLKSAKQLRAHLKGAQHIPKDLVRAVVRNVYLDLRPTVLVKARIEKLTAIVSSKRYGAEKRRAAAEELAEIYRHQEQPVTRVHILPHLPETVSGRRLFADVELPDSVLGVLVNK